MGRKHGKLTKKELGLRLKTKKRKQLLKKASPKSYIKPEDFMSSAEKAGATVEPIEQLDAATEDKEMPTVKVEMEETEDNKVEATKEEANDKDKKEE